MTTFKKIIYEKFSVAQLKDEGNQVRVELANDGIIHWAPKTGTVWAQGQEKEDTTQKLIEAFNNRITVPTKVFVVYGHDTQDRAALELLLRRWQLEPLILDNLPSAGQTIIEKLEHYTSEDVGYAVILATPDDEGHKANCPDEKAYRARQNVILELGMMLARLGRKKVAVLLKNQEMMERPSDIQGVIYIPYKDDLIKETQVLLAKEMLSQGYQISLTHL